MRMTIRKFISLMITFLLISCSTNTQNSPIGDWSGTLSLGGGELRLVFHITSSENNYAATIESVDQGGAIIPTGIEVNGSALRFVVLQLSVEYIATLSGNEIVGVFTQAGMSMPNFTLTRIE